MLEDLKANNRRWAAGKLSVDPGFFKRLENQQSPEYLWIGCSDSRVPANEIVNLDPGELFVHRNVANLAPPQDANYLSVLQFAVDGKRRGLVDHWLHPIREVYAQNRVELEALSGPTRLNRLIELNVVRQVRNVASDVFVQDAWARGQDLCVHGWVYSIANGLVTDLNAAISGPADLEKAIDEA